VILEPAVALKRVATHGRGVCLRLWPAVHLAAPRLHATPLRVVHSWVLMAVPTYRPSKAPTPRPFFLRTKKKTYLWEHRLCLSNEC
jgi:hypothetical protein